MGLNILGEDSRVERGGQDGRSSSGYSQEQPCKRSKDGGKGGKMATRRSRGEGRNVLRKGDKGKGLSYCSTTFGHECPQY